VTTLRRTVETASPLAKRLGIEPRIERSLREVYLGEWEGGLLRVKAVEHDPAFVRAVEEERWDPIPGAEPAEAFRERVLAGIATVADAHPDQLVVVVTHGGVIGQVLSSATGARGFAFIGADNASISHVVVEEDRITLRRFNDTTHLHPHFSVAAPPPI
jgi:probable phosphoglycerate mutase